jgi:uncharacterized membrane protein YjdF
VNEIPISKKLSTLRSLAKILAWIYFVGITSNLLFFSIGAYYSTSRIDISSIFIISIVMGIVSLLGFVIFPITIYFLISDYYSYLQVPFEWICDGGGAGSGWTGVVQDEFGFTTALLPGAIFATTVLAQKTLQIVTGFKFSLIYGAVLSIILSAFLSYEIDLLVVHAIKNESHLVNCG